MTDPRIRYDILANAEGQQDVLALAAALEKVDGSLDPAIAARAQQLATELRELGQQRQALEQFQSLGEAARSANRDLAATTNKFEDLQRTIEQSGKITKEQTGQLQKLEAELGKTRDRASAAGTALDEARQRLERFGGEVPRLATVGGALQQVEARSQALRAEVAQLGKDASLAAEQQAAAAREQAQADEEAAAAMKLLEQAAQKADAEFRQLVSSLQATETAAREYASATERAAAAGAEDVSATQQRVRAAEALIASEQTLDVAQSNLARERDRSRAALVAEAQALLQSARAADESRAATARLVSEARSAANVLDAAFSKTGVRSLQAIEAEMLDVERAMSLLERRYQAGAISAQDLARATASATSVLNQLKREAATIPSIPGRFEQLSTSINGMVSKWTGLGAAVAAVGATVGAAVRPAIEATVALEQMRRVLTTVTGSSQEAERQIDFLRRTSQASGQQFSQIGESYAKFAASALQSGLTLQQTQEVFRSVAMAAGNLGLSSEQAQRALEALSQMASKGVVSMEELRQQLGDSLPGVLPALAKELGITQSELVKLIESGQLAAYEAIPAIARSLKNLQPQDGVVTGMVATWNRFINVLKQAGTELTEGPLGASAGFLLDKLALSVRLVATVAVSASAGVEFLAKSIGATTAYLAGGAKGFDEYAATIDRFAQDSAKRINDFKETAFGARDSVDSLGAAAAKVGPSFAAMAVEQAKAISSAELLSQTTEKVAQAAEKEAEAAGALIGLIDNEALAKQRAADVAARVATARDAAAAAARGEVDALKASRQAAIDRAGTDEQAQAGIKTYVEALDKKIEKADADAKKSEAAAQKARELAEASKLAAQMVGDQSGRYAELAEAVGRAQKAYDFIVRQYIEGRKSAEDLAGAEKELVKAKKLLRDAIDDQDAATQRLLNSIKAEAEFTKAQIELDIAKLKVKKAEADQRGLTIQSRQYEMQIAELELQLTKSGTNAKRDEANALIRSLEVRKQELRAIGQLTPEIEADINARIRSAQAQTLQADAADVASAAQTKHLDRVRAGIEDLDSHSKSTASNTSAMSSSTSAIEANTKAREGNTKATSQQTEAQRAYEELLLNDPSRMVSGSSGGGTLDDGSVTAARNASVVSNAGKPASAGTTNADGSIVYDAQGFATKGGQRVTQSIQVVNPYEQDGPTMSGASSDDPRSNPANWQFDNAAWAKAGYPVTLERGKFHADKFWKYVGPSDYGDVEQAAADQSGMSLAAYRRMAANAARRADMSTSAFNAEVVAGKRKANGETIEQATPRASSPASTAGPTSVNSSTGTNSAPARTVRVELTVNGGRVLPVTASEDVAEQLLRALEQGQRMIGS